MKYRELGKVKQIVEESCGLDITHAYDDLVFVEQSAFLIRFCENPNAFDVFFNRECIANDRIKLASRLSASSLANGMQCADAGSFSFEQSGEEELSIQFYEPARSSSG